MATAPLPHIARKFIKPNGKVDLWDIADKDDPVKLEFTAILAREALQRDKERYKLELPKGVKPGAAQAEAERRAAEEMAEADAEPPDPVYGRRNQA